MGDTIDVDTDSGHSDDNNSSGVQNNCKGGGSSDVKSDCDSYEIATTVETVTMRIVGMATVRIVRMVRMVTVMVALRMVRTMTAMMKRTAMRK